MPVYGLRVIFYPPKVSCFVYFLPLDCFWTVSFWLLFVPLPFSCLTSSYKINFGIFFGLLFLFNGLFCLVSLFSTSIWVFFFWPIKKIIHIIIFVFIKPQTHFKMYNARCLCFVCWFFIEEVKKLGKYYSALSSSSHVTFIPVYVFQPLWKDSQQKESWRTELDLNMCPWSLHY